MAAELKDVHVRLGLVRLCSMAGGDAVMMADQNRGRVAAGMAALKPADRLCLPCARIVIEALRRGPQQ